MGIGTKRLLKIHLYEPEADFGFWHIHVERIFCEKRRRGRGKKREKEEKKKEDSLHFQAMFHHHGIYYCHQLPRTVDEK